MEQSPIELWAPSKPRGWKLFHGHRKEDASIRKTSILRSILVLQSYTSQTTALALIPIIHHPCLRVRWWGCGQVDTEMDLPLAMDRPDTEAVTPESITISFFAPRPTLPKMKIQSFVMQVT